MDQRAPKPLLLKNDDVFTFDGIVNSPASIYHLGEILNQTNLFLSDLDPQRDLDILSSHLKRAVADLQEMTLRYDQLLKEKQWLTRLVQKYQEQRDFYGEEITKAISERDEARRERDEMCQQFSDIQKEKDEAMRKFLLETRDFERRHEIDTAEMRALRERPVQTEEKLRSLQLESELSLNIRQSTMVSSCTVYHPDLGVTLRWTSIPSRGGE